jgi:Fic-DOC domain mobile mystery protein B
LTRQQELDEFEEANILEAMKWLHKQNNADALNVEFIHTLHRRMFGKTWAWAGKPRRTDKNIGVPAHQIAIELRLLVDDVRAQIEYRSYAPMEIAARFHHRLVAIHVFPNGNGRHAREMADLLLLRLEGRRFNWGRGSLTPVSELRSAYIDALRSADRGDYASLLHFLDCNGAA